jgi:hypothetical protein
MHIFLDTTVLRSDFYLASPDARLLQQFVRTTGATLAVPLIVIEETKNKFREELEKGAVEINKLSRLLPANSRQLPVLDINTQVRDYEIQLLERLSSDFRFRALDFPEVSHRELVERDLRRRKPFSKSGEGYRDALIWHSILETIKSAKDEFVFITDNARDFWNDAAKDLHPELRVDFGGLGGIVGPFRVFRTLAAFNDEVVKPKLEKIDGLLLQLRTGKFPFLSIKNFADECKQEVSEELDSRDALRQIHWQYSLPTNDLTFVDFGYIGLRSVDAIEVLEMPDANLFIRFNADYAITALVSVPTEQAAKWEDAGMSLESEPDVGEALMLADFEIRGEFSLTYDPQSRTVESYKISTEFV